MSDTHEIYEHWAAAYTLGALDADDRNRFEHHLQACPRCAAAVASFAPLPGLIAKVEPREVLLDLTDEQRRSFAAVASDELAALRRSARRWRRAALSSAGAAAAAIAALTLFPADGDDGPQPIVADVISSEAATTLVTAEGRAWGTQIHIELTELPARESYSIWVVDDSGGWSPAATWSPTPSGNANVTGATSTPTAEIERILVTSQDPVDVLIEAAT